MESFTSIIRRALKIVIIGGVIAFTVFVFFVTLVRDRQNPCRHRDSVQCLDYRVSQCMQLERYTIDQCINLSNHDR